MDMIKEDPSGNMWTCQKCVNKIEKAAELSKPLTVDEIVNEVSGKINTTCTQFSGIINSIWTHVVTS